MSKDLLFEIGTEELPAKVVPRALSALEGFLRKNLEAKRLAFSSIKTLGTPRRLTLVVNGLADRQPDSRVELKGPQKKAAYDSEGKPTGALLGFARSQGLDLNDIKLVQTDKGEYATAVKEIKGEDTANILPGVLLDTISQEFMPKSMRWGSYDISFSRPIHWIVALFGGSKVEFSYGHINSSDITYGHRFLSERQDGRPKPIKVGSVESYLKGLEASFVIADPEERKKAVRQGIEQSAKEAGGKVLPDEGLLEEIAYLVEYPVVLRGSFEKEFLSLPRDIIVNAMREHQRYFSVVDSNGGLLPYFITVANTLAVDMNVVRKGNERVLRARLNDAKFYFEQDIKKPLVDRVEALKGVVFQAKLGTSFEKVERFTSLALYIGEKAGFSRPAQGDRPSDFATDGFNPAKYDPKSVDPGLYSKYIVGRAALLSKADLTSGVVGEFPSLQGIMGSVYAKRGGEAPEVSVAIYEHYLPASSGGQLPASVAGSIVSIADKMDTICGCFSVGLIPSGAADPYALRRQALGIIAIILEKGFKFGIDELVDEALRLLEPKMKDRGKGEVKEGVLEFFKERLRNQLLSQGLSHDSIDAVLSAPWFEVNDAVKRIKALEEFKANPDCQRLVVAFKRVSNILKLVNTGETEPNVALFREPQESALFEASRAIAPKMKELRERGDYSLAFETLASIKDKIDAFFDKVMVMAEDLQIRQNRLILLNSIRDLYFRIADLSRLMV